MLTEKLMIVGAGGHAKVVVDSALHMGFNPENLLISDDNIGLDDKHFMGLQIQTPILKSIQGANLFHIAIGDNQDRERLYKECLSENCRPCSVIHANSVQASFVELADGVFIAANSTIGPDASVGAGTIINHGSVVDHDCKLGRFVHIAPNAALGGGVCIGDRTLVGAGAVLLPGIKVASDVTIGAGAVVVKDIMQSCTVAGMPAKQNGKSS